MEDFWQIDKKEQKYGLKNKIKIDNTIISNPNQITESFNNFFTKIGENLAQSLGNNEPEDYKEYLGDPIPQSLSLTETDQTEIGRLLENIDPKKSTGNDDLPGIFLKISAPTIAGPLSKLFNLSINSGEYPKNCQSTPNL